MARASGKGIFDDLVRPYLIKLAKRGRPRSVYKGQVYEMPGMHMRPRVEYAKRTRAQTKAFRKEFNNRVRKQFVKSLDRNVLRKHGFTERQIKDMLEKGKVPRGYQVHHILPIDDSGTNSFDNLVLIRNSPDHQLVTNYQRYTTNGMVPGDVRHIDWPAYPPGTTVWPPPGMGAYPIPHGG